MQQSKLSNTSSFADCLILLDTNIAVLIFVSSVSSNFGESFCADLECSFDRSAFDLVTMRRSKGGSVQAAGGQQSIAFKCKCCRGIFDSSVTARLHTGNTEYTIWHKVQDAPITAIWLSSPFRRAVTWLQGYCGNWTHLLRHWNNYFHCSQLFSLFSRE